MRRKNTMRSSACIPSLLPSCRCSGNRQHPSKRYTTTQRIHRYPIGLFEESMEFVCAKSFGQTLDIRLHKSQSPLYLCVAFLCPFALRIIKFHFTHKRDTIHARMQQWLDMCPLQSQKDLVRQQVESLDNELLRLAMSGVALENM